MNEEKQSQCCDKKWGKGGWRGDGGTGAMYFFGFIGAAVYFISQAPTFWLGVLGFLKAIVWPAFIVYEALKLLIG